MEIESIDLFENIETEIDNLERQNEMLGVAEEFIIEGSEIVMPDYCNTDILKVRKYYRIMINGKRYYYDNPLNINLRTSVTTLLHSQMPINSFLLDWLFQFDNRQSYDNYMQSKADYGTIMHALFTKLLMNKEVNVSLEVENLKELLNTTADIKLNELKKDVICFIKWIIDYRVEPIAVELPVMNGQYAGTVDLVCYLYINDIRYTCIVDYKSGRKGFYDSHRVQLHAYKQLLKECYDIDIDLMFNFSPTEFTKELSKHSIKQPIYKFENQSDPKYTAMWDMYCKLYELSSKDFITKTSYSDVLSFENVENSVTVEKYKVGV